MTKVYKTVLIIFAHAYIRIDQTPSPSLSQSFTHQKSLKSVNFWQGYLKNKKVDVFWDTVYNYNRL